MIAIITLSAIFLPIGVIASGEENAGDIVDNMLRVEYDYSREKTYQVEGRSMEPLGFAHDDYVNVVPTSRLRVGDVIAFTCTHEKCDGAYIKRIKAQKQSCYWVEGRRDNWIEDGVKKQSLDSRTSYGWLCEDEIDVMGVAFPKNA